MNGPTYEQLQDYARRAKRVRRAVDRLMKVIEGELRQAPHAERLTLALTMAASSCATVCALLSDMRGHARAPGGPSAEQLEEVLALLRSANALNDGLVSVVPAGMVN